jgi:branched-chain amino acid transport system substrate-binding protein
MASKKETRTLVISLATTVAVISAGLWWGLQQLSSDRNGLTSFTLSTGAVRTPSPGPRVSQGADELISAESTPAKRAGIQAYRRQDYREAIAQFQTALQQHRNDPETLIYLNNSRAMSLAEKPVKLAVSVPIGSNLNVAQEILRGVAQAQDEVNFADGIQGERVMITIANDENDPTLAKSIATELVKRDVVAVIGHNASNASLAAAPIYQAAGLVMISPTSFANGLSGAGMAIFRTVPTIRFMADPLAQHVITTARKTNIAICADSQAPDNLSFRDEFTASFLSRGGKIVSINCDVADPAFNPTAAIAQAISGGADSLLLAAHVDRIERAVAVARANQGRLSLFASPTLYTLQTVKSGQVDVNGMVLPIPWHSSTGQSAFVAQAKQQWGGTVNWRTALAYDATRAILAGLQQNPRREGLAQVLHQPNFMATGAGEPIAFLPTGDRVSQPVLVQVQPGGPTGYDFAPLK